MSKSPPTKPRSGSEDSGSMKKSRKRKKNSNAHSSEDFFHDEMSDDDLDVNEEKSMGAEDLEVDEDASGLSDEQKDEERKSNLRARMRVRRSAHGVRPGDREVLTSRTILILFGSAVVLLLVAVIVYAVIGRNAAEIDFAQAMESYEAKKYTQAIDEFNQFVQNYPRSKDRDTALFLRDKAKIEQYIFGRGGDWLKGLEELNNFILFNKDRDGYVDYKEELRGFSERIALGALKTAENTQLRDLLPKADDARDRAVSLDSEKPFENEYRKDRQMAVVAIQRQEEYDKVTKEIQDALDNKDSLQAIVLRNGLLQQFSVMVKGKKVPTFKRNKVQKLDEFLQQSLDLEKSLTRADELTVDAIVTDRPERIKTNSLSLVLHRRPQDDTQPLKNRVVIAYGDNCLYGIDPLIGVPVWRRSIGYDVPFFPIEEQVREPSLLVFDTHFHEFLLLKKLTGELIWRQPLKDAEGNPETIQGLPIVNDGQIYVTSDTNALYRISIDTGRVMGRWQCSQNLVGPPVFQDTNTKLVIAGEASFVYTILTASFDCDHVHYTGHSKGSLAVPLTKIGKLVMLCENELNSSPASLRIFNTSGIGEWMQELTPQEPEKRVRVDGQIRHNPILRSKTLYLSFGNERIKTFSVSDDLRPSQTEQLSQNYLVLDATHDQQSDYAGPEYIIPGANRQFWLFASKLSKFGLGQNSINAFPESTAEGTAWHRPQEMNEFFYLARKVPYRTGVIFTQTDRQQMKGNWRAVIGSPIAGMLSSANGPLICVNDAGEVFRLQERDFTNEKFFTDRNANVAIPPVLTAPLRIFPVDEKLLGVVTQGDKTELSIVNSLGLVNSRHTLRQPLEANPVKIDDGLVLPMSGKLSFTRLDGRFGRVDDFEPDYDQSKKGVHWKTLIALDGQQVVAIDSLGTIFRVQMQKNAGQNYLKAVRQRNLAKPVHHGMAFSGAHLFVADIEGKLLDLDSIGLTERGSLSLTAPVSNDLWVENNLLFAEVGSEALHCFSFVRNLKEVWSYPLGDDSGLAGKPMAIDAAIVIVKRNGEIVVLDSNTGNVKKTLNLHEPLSGPLRKYRDRWMVPSIDGSLHTVDLDKLLKN